MNKKLLIAIGLSGLAIYLLSNQGQELVNNMYGSLKRGERINNPGNIRKGASWQGLSDDQSIDSAFAVFTSPFYGLRAMAKLLSNYYSQGLNTITKIISKYAPSSENNTSAYIATVSRISGIDPNTPFPLNAQNLQKIMTGMITVEQGRVIYTADAIKQAIEAV